MKRLPRPRVPVRIVLPQMGRQFFVVGDCSTRRPAMQHLQAGEELARYMRAGYGKWGRVVRETGATVNQ